MPERIKIQEQMHHDTTDRQALKNPSLPNGTITESNEK